MKTEAVVKYLLSLFLAIPGLLLASYASGSWPFSVLVGWDIFGLTYIIFSLVIFYRIPQQEIRKRCSEEDTGTWLLFLLVLIACLFGLGTVLSLVNSREELEVAPWLATVVGIGAIVISWMMVHTSFTFRYAHLFYGEDNKQFAQHARGLAFPEEEEPDYYDFAYFSFVVGMTFQVSDVTITSRGVRRLVLVHSLIAFLFNTVIIALTISELVNLK